MPLLWTTCAQWVSFVNNLRFCAFSFQLIDGRLLLPTDASPTGQSGKKLRILVSEVYTSTYFQRKITAPADCVFMCGVFGWIQKKTCSYFCHVSGKTLHDLLDTYKSCEEHRRSYCKIFWISTVIAAHVIVQRIWSKCLRDTAWILLILYSK